MQTDKSLIICYTQEHMKLKLTDRQTSVVVRLAIIGLTIALMICGYNIWKYLQPHTLSKPTRNITLVTTKYPIKRTQPATPAPVLSISVSKQITYRVPILMYHYIRIVTNPADRLGYNLSVTPQNFAAQVQWLTENGYQTFPLSDFCQGKISTKGKPIILTFDDGHNDAYTQALPVLQKYHQMGTFFIISHFLNRPQYLSTAQLAGLKAAGEELGDHTMDHVDLANESPTEQQKEIIGAEQSSPVFAYPSSKYTQTTEQLLAKDGFLCAVTEIPAIATNQSPLYQLPRVRIRGGETLSEFIAAVEGKI